MKIVGQLKAILGLDKTRFDRGLNQAEKKTSQFSSGMKKLAGAMAAAFSVTLIIAWVRSLKAAYQVQKEAEVKLATILKQRMGLGEEAVKSLQKQASEYQKIGVVGDEVQLSGLQQLATFLRQKQSLEALLPAMNNLLAQQKGYNATAMDAVGIANMMGKVLDGQVSSLRRIGISLTDVQAGALKSGNEFERASLLAQIITDNVGNMNEEMGKTDLGKIKNLSNAWGDVKEEIGRAIVGAKAYGAVVQWLRDIIEIMQDPDLNFWQKINGSPNDYKIWKQRQAEAKQSFTETTNVLFPGLVAGLKKVTDGTKETNQSNVEQIKTIAQLREAIADYKEQIEETTIAEQGRRNELLKQIQETENLITKLTTLERKLVAIEKISGLKAPAVSAGFPAAPGIQPFVGTIATGAEINQRQIEEMTQALYDQQTAVAILSNAFETLFTSTEDGFKAMIDSIILGLKRLVAELLARAAVLTILNIVSGGFAGALKGVLKGAAGSMFPGLTGKVAGGANGLTVPSGYPHDTFPAMLSSGETVLTANQTRNLNRSIEITVTGEIAGRAIAVLGRRTERDN